MTQSTDTKTPPNSNESSWRSEELQIKRDDLKCKQGEARDKRKAMVAGLIAAIIAAAGSIWSSHHSAQSAERAAKLRWQQQLVDDQRRSLQADIQVFARTLNDGIGLVYRAAADHQIPNRKFSPEAAIQWERDYRAQLRAQNEATLAVHLDDPKVSQQFHSLHKAWADLGDEVSAILAAGKGASPAKWRELQKRLLAIQLADSVNSVRHLIARPTVRLNDADQ